MATESSTKSSRPNLEEERCNFSLTIKHDITHNRMYVRKNRGCCLSHNEHSSVPFEKRITGLNDLPDHDLGKIGKFTKKNFPSTIIRDYVELETGHSLSNSSIRKLQSIVLNQAHGNEDMTPAQSLINYLESVPGLEYKTLTRTYGEAVDLVTVRQQNKYSAGKAKLETGKFHFFVFCCFLDTGIYNSLVTCCFVDTGIYNILGSKSGNRIGLLFLL